MKDSIDSQLLEKTQKIINDLQKIEDTPESKKSHTDLLSSNRCK